MQIIAHRGFSAKYIQNTMVAFAEAALVNVDAIELDIHQVEDDFVVFHDFYVDKLTNKSGRISTFSLEEIKQISVLDKGQIPLLSEVTDLLSDRVKLNIEIKHIESPQTFARYISTILEQHASQLVISSFNHHLLQQCHELMKHFPNIEFAALTAQLPLDFAKYASELDANIAAIDCEMVTKAFVEDAHQRDMEVWCYTVNHAETLAKLMSIGVDAIFSDDPIWAKNEVEKISNAKLG